MKKTKLSKKEYCLNFEANLMIDVKLRTNGLIVYELYEDIDGKKLSQAVRKALRFHPVFQTRLIKKGRKYHLLRNKKPPVILETAWDEAVDYGTKEFHDYPWMISFTENKIVFITAHFLTDGGGQDRFMSTVLSLYFGLDLDAKEKNRKRIERTAREGFKETGIRKVKKTPIQFKKEKGLALADDFYDFENHGNYLNRLEIERKDIAKITASNDTSTFAVLSALACESVAMAAKLEDGFVTANVAVDIRNVYDSETDLLFTYTPILKYDVKRLRGKGLDLASTAMRSQLDICIDKDNIDNYIAKYNKINGILRPLIIKLARKAYRDNIRGKRANIIYSHMTHVGLSADLQKRVKSVYLSGMNGNSPLILFHAVSYKDKIIISINENSRDFMISQKFQTLLQNEDIHVEREIVPGHGMLVYCPECWEESHIKFTH